jgi:hypothetical protein
MVQIKYEHPGCSYLRRSCYEVVEMWVLLLVAWLYSVGI